ncbi:MAG: ribonuclease R [Pseudomonadota bacterium]
MTLIALQKALRAEHGDRRRVLLQVIKGLVRTGELSKVGQGRYQFVAGSGADDLGADDAASAGPSKGSVAADALAQAVRLGILVLETRYPYVESTGEQAGERIYLGPVRSRAYEHGDTVSVRVTGSDRHGLKGQLVARVARGGGAAQAAETLLESYEVPRVWPEGMSAVVEKLPERVASGSYRGREDLRALPLVTIDGITAKDFDDAVYAERAGRGWRLIVAIADVAHYVAPGSLLDAEAQLRGNSVYLPDRVIPMLPEALSNGLCSLRPKERRLAMVCDMRISAAGKVSSHRFSNAVIESHARLTYEQVGGFLAGAELEQPEPVLTSLRTLHALYDALRSAREARGGLDFSGREANVVLDGDRVSEIVPVERNDAHRLIEECMIAANVCAAVTLEKAGLPGMYRVHEPPSAEKTEQLRQALAHTGVRLPAGELNAKVVQAALTEIAQRDDGWLLESQVLRALSQAVYTPANKGHFGLALSRYMHFTSPIRRYADLIVHRALKAVLGEAEGRKQAPRGAHSYDMDQLVGLGEQISATERRADQVSWGVDAWLKCEFMGQFVGEVIAGRIAAVTDFGLFVDLTGYYVQGLVHISELGRDYFHYEALSQSLVGERSGRRFSLGDELKVRLISVNPPRGRMELKLPEREEASSSGGRGRGRGQR